MQILDIIKKSLGQNWAWMLLLVYTLSLLAPDLVWAASSFDSEQQPIIKVLCQVILFVIGPFGKAVCIIVCLCTGFMVIVGKASMPLFLILVAGMGIIFGGPSLVFYLVSAVDKVHRMENLTEFCAL